MWLNEGGCFVETVLLTFAVCKVLQLQYFIIDTDNDLVAED
jgi:hypothetical protein